MRVIMGAHIASKTFRFTNTYLRSATVKIPYLQAESIVQSTILNWNYICSTAASMDKSEA